MISSFEYQGRNYAAIGHETWTVWAAPCRECGDTFTFPSRGTLKKTTTKPKTKRAIKRKS